ncbi:hypothetical protein EV176_003047, partial [Coemansia sp. RSA 451]
VLDGGRYLVAGAKSGRILVWATASGRMLGAWDAHYGAVTALGSSDGVLVSGGEDAAAHVWVLAQALDQLARGDSAVTPIASAAEHTMAISSVHVTPGVLAGRGRIYTAARDHTCKQWRVRVERQGPRYAGRTELLATLLYTTAISDIAVDASETRVFVATAAGLFQSNLYAHTQAGADGTGALTALGGTGSAVYSENHVQFAAAETDVVAVGLSCDGTLAVSASRDGVVRVWDTGSRQCLRTISDKQLAGGVSGVSVQLAPPQLGGPRTLATAGLLRPDAMAEAVVAPHISSISFAPLQRLLRADTTEATAFEAAVKTRLSGSRESMAQFDAQLRQDSAYSPTSRADSRLLGALRPADGSARKQVADLQQQMERLQRHNARTRALNDELYQSTRMTETRSAQFTVGKLDAGMALLLTEDYQLIEFPSVLLPRGVVLGSVVNIDVARDRDTERRQRSEFRELQEQILESFGTRQPQAPVIRVGHTTQTWAVLEWEPLDLAAAELRSLHLYRDGQRMMQAMPATAELANRTRAVKTTGLDVGQTYEFKVEMRTSAGTFFSNTVSLTTHALDNLTGVRVCFGECESQDEIDALKDTLRRIGASWTDSVSLSITHFVARYKSGAGYEAALRCNVPIVKPDWVLACEANGKLQPAIKFHLE